jgi:hypothetical protein
MPFILSWAHITVHQIPDSFTSKYGEPIVVKSAEDLAVGSDDYISWHLLNRACDASNLAFNQAGHTALRVSAAFLSDFEPRSFAYWSPTAPRDYVIAFTRGTCEALRRTLINAEFRSLLPPTSLSLRELHVDDLTALAVSLTVATILYHEVAHVFRFHLPYLTARRASEPTALPTLVGLCEVDADKWCSYLIAPELLAQAKGVHEALGLVVPIESVLSEVLILYGIALYLWFAFFNQTVFPKMSIYPHPLIRATRIAIGAADNIPPTTTDKAHLINRAHSVLAGLAAVEQSMLGSVSSKQHPFDLADELAAINAKFAEIERVLEPALREVESRWSSPSAA